MKNCSRERERENTVFSFGKLKIHLSYSKANNVCQHRTVRFEILNLRRMLLNGKFKTFAVTRHWIRTLDNIRLIERFWMNPLDWQAGHWQPPIEMILTTYNMATIRDVQVRCWMEDENEEFSLGIEWKSCNLALITVWYSNFGRISRLKFTIWTS